MNMNIYKKIKIFITIGILFVSGITSIYSADTEQSVSDNSLLRASADEIIYNIKMVDYLKKALIYGHTSRISS